MRKTVWRIEPMTGGETCLPAGRGIESSYAMDPSLMDTKGLRMPRDLIARSPLPLTPAKKQSF